MSPELAEYIYVDSAWGALNRRNHVRRLNELDLKDGGAERYISHRRGTVALLEWTRSHTNQNGQPTIEGFDGPIWDPSLPFDFDDRQDPAHALEWLRQFLERLEREDVPLDALRIYFSGAKGFHLEIPHTLFGGFEPSDQLHVWEKAAAVELMHGIPFDSAVYDKLRLWRVVNTLNAKGNHYKVQLSLTEVRGLSMQEILVLAEAPRPRLPSAPDSDWQPNDYLVEVWARARSGGVQPVGELTQSAWSDDRRHALTFAVLAAAIAASWPADPAISRHSDYLLPLSGFLARHMDAASVAALLKEAARQSGDRGFLDDRTRHWEAEIDRLAEGSAAKIEAGGQVEGLPTLSRRFPELVEVVSAQFVSFSGSKVVSKNGQLSHGFTLTVLRDALEEPIEMVAYLVDGLLPTGGVSLWGAKPKVGKSVAVRNLALSVARGEPFLGRACHQGTVLIFALEEKRSEVINHFREMGADEEQVHLHTGAAPPSSKEGIAAIANLINVYQPALVVVDPVFKLVRVRDSSDYAELTRELEPVIELARNTGCHIAVTHHLGKQLREGGDDVLGSTAIFGAVDTLVVFRRRKDNLRVVQTIQRYGADLAETIIPMDEATGRISLGNAVAALKVIEAKQRIQEILERQEDSQTGLDQKAVREQAELDRTVAHQALQELAAEGIIERLGEGRRGNPYRYRLSVFLSSPTSRQDRNTETQGGQQALSMPPAADSFVPPDVGSLEPELSIFQSSPTSRQDRNTETRQLEEGPVCLGCGKPLSEDLVSAGLHPGCSLES